MAILKVITAAIAAFFIVSTSVRANECVSLDIYHSTLSSEGITLYGSRAAATQQMGLTVNKNRAKVGNSTIEVSIFLVGYVKDSAGEVSAIVGIFDNNGCLIQDTFATLTLKQWIEFLQSSGVDPKDFVQLDGA